MLAAEIFFALLNNCLFGKELPESIAHSITEERAELIYKCAKGHDVAQIIASSVFENALDVPSDFAEKLKKQQLLAVFRYRNMKSELERISELFETEGIPYILLKGAFIRDLYPEPYLRTSSDIDILVHEADVVSAVALLNEKCGYTSSERSYHDYSMHSESGVHLELHFNLLENMENIDRLLSHPWDHALGIVDSCQYRFTNEFTLFHIVAHMSYHFATGGCGVRPFIDLYLLESKLSFDRASFEKMLLECGLVKFYEAAKKLCLVWFEGLEQDELTREMERFILTGGVNGSKKKSIAAKQQRKGGKIAYLSERIFQPYGIMKEKYPILKKHKYLLPFCHVKRWFSLLKNGKMSDLKKEYNADKAVEMQKAEDMNAFLSKLGIN